MKPLGMKLLYNKHDVLKQNNSFINHSKECCNASGGSAATFLLIYAVRTQIYSGIIFFKVFIYLYLFLAVLGLQCGMRASHWRGFSYRRAEALELDGFSSCGSWALEHWLSLCSTWTYVLYSMWDPFSPGIKPMSSAGGCFATEGK